MKPFLYLLLFLCFPLWAQQDTASIEKYTIEEFYENTRVGGGVFSEDEKKLLMDSDESGIFNLYEIQLADGSKKQITNSTTDSFFAIDYVPGSGEILYSADKGGNEISHIYLLGKDGKSKDLTPGENEKAMFGSWSDDKKSMIYLSKVRDPQFFDVYKMDIGKWEPQMIYRNDKGFQLEGISHDENLLMLSQPITTSEN
ncbi:TolB family protein, partial [Salinimicrobium oceani]|nr:S9 family peptidase [Salinimicrobium oceani]